MRRRTFVAALGAAAAGSLAPGAFAETTLRRIGFVFAGSQRANVTIEGLSKGLTERGYSLGRDLVIEQRYGEGRSELMPALIEDILTRNPEVLASAGSATTLLMRKLAPTLPIVCVTADPVGVGLAQSLAHPGGNVTGMSSLSVDFAAKWFDLLRTAVPRLKRLAVLYEPGNVAIEGSTRRIEEAAARIGVTTIRLSGLSQDFDASVAALTAANFDALLVVDSPLLELRLPELIKTAALNRLPALYTFSTAVRLGGLMSYSADFLQIWRRAAGYVNRILKGAKPADLPIEQATEIKLAINLGTAAALDLEVPPIQLAGADEVIE